jgi:hypothetical protein
VNNILIGIAGPSHVPQGSPHFILLNSTILFDVYMLGKICIMNAVLRGHSLKSVDADALAEMRSG